jgi:hypothetical protein
MYRSSALNGRKEWELGGGFAMLDVAIANGYLPFVKRLLAHARTAKLIWPGDARPNLNGPETKKR